MFVFVVIGFFLAGLAIYFINLQFVDTRYRKNMAKRAPGLLEEVSAIFGKFRYTMEIGLFLGLFLSANNEKAVEEVYNKSKNLEIARKVVINMSNRVQ